MRPRTGGLVVLALLLASTAHAEPPGPGLHGILLGMTPDQASDAAHLPCQTPQYSTDLSCKDTSDGSEYRAMFSAGEPSIALSVQHGFCSHLPADALLKDTLAMLGAPADRAHTDPNGFHVDLAGDNEAVLSPDRGECPSGDKRFVLLVRSNGLIKMSSDKAVERVKKSLH